MEKHRSKSKAELKSAPLQAKSQFGAQLRDGDDEEEKSVTESSDDDGIAAAAVTTNPT